MTIEVRYWAKVMKKLVSLKTFYFGIVDKGLWAFINSSQVVMGHKSL